MHKLSDVIHQVLTASDAAIQEKKERASPWICRDTSSGYLVILDVSWNHSTALKFLPVIRVALLVGLQCTVVSGVADRGTVDKEPVSVEEDDTDLSWLCMSPLLRLPIIGNDLAS
ncbi:MAG TPA: hypothetical protein VFC37_00010 [Terracidiphilus sp.]|nr:hypothetical protein [Terracidiphilus sp.]